jgi:hypothetical protein
VKIVRSKAGASYQVGVPLEDAEVREDMQGLRYLPDLVDIRYEYSDGRWSLNNVWLHGTAVKRDGTPGKPRRYELWAASGLHDAPEFVRELVQEYWPGASRGPVMPDSEYYRMTEHVYEALARNAAHSFDINFDYLNRGTHETDRRLRAASINPESAGLLAGGKCLECGNDSDDSEFCPACEGGV